MKAERRSATTDHSSSMVLAAAFLSSALSLEKAISIGLKVGRVWRQEQEPCPDLLDGLAHAAYLVGRQVVHHDDVAGAKLGRENLFGIGQEGGHHSWGHRAASAPPCRTAAGRR